MNVVVQSVEYCGADPTRNIQTLPSTVWPQFDWCRLNWRKFNFQKFESTWVSVTTKGVK